jgi:hypothetical protein
MPTQGNQRQCTARPGLVRFPDLVDQSRWLGAPADMLGCTELSVLATAVLAAVAVR